MSLAASEGSRAAARRHHEKGMRAAYVNPFWSNRAAGLRAGIGLALSGRNCAGFFVATRTAASHQARTMATPVSVPDRGRQHALRFHGTGTGARLQICWAYSRMVRSLENFPTRAMFSTALRAQPSLSR